MRPTEFLVLRPEWRGQEQDPQAPMVRPEAGQPGPPGEPGQATPTGPNGQPGAPKSPCGLDSGTILMLVGFLAIFYFLILRPSQKQEKARRALLGSIKKGDKVATSGGLYGVITNLTEQTVTLLVDKDVKLTFDRSAIARVVAGDEPQEQGSS